MTDSLQSAKFQICQSLGWAGGAEFPFHSLDELSWRKLLTFLDEQGLTLLFRRKFRQASFPEWVSRRLERNFADNGKRCDAALSRQRTLVEAFATKKIDAALLKGLAVACQAYPDKRDRVQYDLDFFVRPEELQRAARVCTESGYQFDKHQDPDHVCLVLPQTYSWGGNFFDPSIPLKIELHGQLWHKRYLIDLGGLLSEPETVVAADPFLHPVRLLSPADHFLFLNLHFFRHLFQNQVRLSHLYEIAVFLQDAHTWSGAIDRVGARAVVRRILFLNLHLALRIFGAPVEKEIFCAGNPDLPLAVSKWLQEDAVKDLLSRFSGNKNYVLLQMEFSGRRWQVLKGALTVHRLPIPARVSFEMQHSTARSFTVKYTVYTLRKAWEHLRGYIQLLFKLRRRMSSELKI